MRRLVATVLVGAMAACDSRAPRDAAPDAARSAPPDATRGAPPDAARSAMSIVVDAGASGRPITIHQGFLHALVPATPGPALERIRALRPNHWRANDGAIFPLATALGGGIEVELVLSDGFLAAHPPPIRLGTGCSGCFATFEDLRLTWQRFVEAAADQLVGAGVEVAYVDILNEPEGSWQLDAPQLVEIFGVAHDVFRTRAPSVRLVGPSTSAFPDTLGPILDLFIARGIHLDALSWHEFGMPEDIVAHVATARSTVAAAFAERPDLAPREIQLNELASGQHHLIPGWILGYLAYVDQAEVDWANRACWYPEPGGVSECASGLDGLLLPDGVTPQATYWVHHSYAAQTGFRLPAVTPDPRIVALASRDGARDEVRVLLGRYSCGERGSWCRFADHPIADTPLATLDVDLELGQLPFATANVRIDLLRISAVQVASALTEDGLARSTLLVPLEAGRAVVPLGGLGDGDVLEVVATPAP